VKTKLQAMRNKFTKAERAAFNADAGQDQTIENGNSVTLSAEDVGENVVYNWYDSDGNLVYVGKDMTVSPEVTEQYQLEVIADADGFKDYDEVEIKVEHNHIDNISPNPASSVISVDYTVEENSSSYLSIIGITNSTTTNNYILDSNQSSISISTSSFPTGVYTVILVVDGQILDAKGLSIL